jgi:hypothetical protein
MSFFFRRYEDYLTAVRAFRRECLRASLPSRDSSWVKAAKAEDGSQPSRQSSRVAPGQGLTNHLVDCKLDYLCTTSSYVFEWLTEVCMRGDGDKKDQLL